MTAVRRPDVAARSTRAGAVEFITKPFDLSRIEELLRNVASEASSRERPYHPGIQEDWRSERIVGKSRVLLELFQSVGKVAGSDAPVLLLGQRGVGKELIARSIHDLGGRTGPFVAVNIPRSPETSRRRSCSGTRRGRSPGRRARARGSCPPRRTAPFSSTRSATRPSICRPSCCGSCRSGSTPPWAPTRRGRSAAGSSRRPTAICGRWWRTGGSGRTSSTA